MIKFIAFRIIRSRVRSYLPMINLKLYRKIFTLTYKFFIFLKPSQLLVIVLALLNKTELKKIIGIPSMVILFNTLFSDPNTPNLDLNGLFAKLEANKFTDPENNWENFFWILIILAMIKRFFVSVFKFLWVPFKIAFIYYILKYFGFDFSYAYNILNNLSLGVVDWFYNKITNFLELFYPNDNNT